MTHDDHRNALALHALGLTDVRDRGGLDAHLSTCPACRDELLALDDAVAHLATLAAPMTPSPGHLHRVLAALEVGDESRRTVARRPQPSGVLRPAARRWGPLRVAARLAVGAALLLLVGSQIELRERLSNARDELRRTRAMGAFVTSPNVSVVSLWGARASRGAHAKLVYDRTTGGFVLLSADLTPLPDGERYQLWVIADGVHRAAAFVSDQPDGRLIEPPHGEGLFFFAVSIESSEDAEEPTGPLVLMSAPLRNPS